MKTSMYLNTTKVNGKTREDLIDALADLGKFDADFCGDNGIEYLWDCVDGNKYESNREYLLDVVRGLGTDREVIHTYISTWIGGDSYYQDYELQVIYDDNDKAEFIALAVIC